MSLLTTRRVPLTSVLDRDRLILDGLVTRMSTCLQWQHSSLSHDGLLFAVQARGTGIQPLRSAAALVQLRAGRYSYAGHIHPPLVALSFFFVATCKKLHISASCFATLSFFQQVFSEALFRGESVPTDLHLQVCQTASPVHTIVMGCK